MVRNILPPRAYYGHADDDPNDKFHEECGVFGAFGNPEAGVITVLGLHALQHRGQEAAGLASVFGGEFYMRKKSGLVGDIFGRHEISRKGIKGYGAIGHTRYSTVNGTGARNIQPLFAQIAIGGVAMAHNGNIVNASALRHTLIQQGHIFQSDLDSEVILQLLARAQGSTIVDRLTEALHDVVGGYALVILTEKELVGVRDPNGIRPLVLGRLRSGGWILSSETCSFDLVAADFVREIAPGEIIRINADDVRSFHPFSKVQDRLCIFETVYFSRPDSTIRGLSVYQTRINMGIETAKEIPLLSALRSASVVVPIPDSGTPSAFGFARQLNIPCEMGIIRNHYVGRTFIEPTQTIRNFGVRMKHSPNASVLKGRDVILVDDSLVRGTTSAKIIDIVRAAGARKIHMVITSPMVRFPCVYGIDMPMKEDLLASERSITEMESILKADSLWFLSIDGLYRALGHPQGRQADSIAFADHVFTGEYCTPLSNSPHARSLQQTLLEYNPSFEEVLT